MATDVLITGNTYPVRAQIKALGGRWSAAGRGWLVPEDAAPAARALVEGGPGVASADEVQRSEYAPGRARRREQGTWCPCGARGCRPGACENCDGEGYLASETRAA